MSLMAQMRRTEERKTSVEIAYITEGRTWRANPTLSRYYAGAVERASELGFELLLFDLAKEPMSDQRLQQILWTRNVQGVIIAPHFNRPTIKLNWTNLSPVVIGYYLPELPLHRIAAHHLNNTVQGLKKVEKAGFKRPALALTVSLDKGAVRNMIAAHRLSTRPLPSEGFLEYLSRRWRKVHFIEWVRKHDPDLVVGIGYSVREALSEESRVSGKHYAYLQMNVQSSDPFGGIDQQSRMVGAAAVDTVAEQLYSNSRGLPATPKTVLIEGRWNERPVEMLYADVESARKAGINPPSP